MKKEITTPLPNKLLTAKEINNKADSDYRVYTYNITRNDKAKIGINEAIKKYEERYNKKPL